MQLNNSPAEVLTQFLHAACIFGDPEALVAPLWPLYFGYLPDKGTPDNAAAMFDSEGVKDGRLMTGENIFHHGVQILIRSTHPEEGWERATQVADLFENVVGNEITVGFMTYTIANISQSSPILPLGLEQGTKQRNLFAVNFLVTMKGAGRLEFTKKFNLVSGVAQNLVTLALRSGEMKGGSIDFVIVCSDGTENQVFSGRINYAIENKSDLIQGDVQVFSQNPAVMATDPDGLTVTGGLDVSVPDQASIYITVTTPLTASRFKVYYHPLGVSA